MKDSNRQRVIDLITVSLRDRGKPEIEVKSISGGSTNVVTVNLIYPAIRRGDPLNINLPVMVFPHKGDYAGSVSIRRGRPAPLLDVCVEVMLTVPLVNWQKIEETRIEGCIRTMIGEEASSRIEREVMLKRVKMAREMTEKTRTHVRTLFDRLQKELTDG